MITKAELMSNLFILRKSCEWVEAHKEELIEEMKDHKGTGWEVPDFVLSDVKRFKADTMLNRVLKKNKNLNKYLDIIGYSLLYGTEFIESYDWELYRLFCMHYSLNRPDEIEEQIEEVNSFLECSWVMGDDFYYQY